MLATGRPQCQHQQHKHSRPPKVSPRAQVEERLYIEAAHAARIRQASKGERRSSFAIGRHGRCLRRPVAVNDTQVGLRTDARPSLEQASEYAVRTVDENCSLPVLS